MFYFYAHLFSLTPFGRLLVNSRSRFFWIKTSSLFTIALHSSTEIL